MTVSTEDAFVAINTVRARLTILGFNLAIIAFEIANTRGLGGGSRIEGFETTVHLSTGVALLIGVALSIASMVVFIASSTLNREGTCDRRVLLSGDILMYLALSQTVSGFFSSYERVLAVMSMQPGVEQTGLATLQTGMAVAGSSAWLLTTYVGPIVSLAHSQYGRVYNLIHVTAYLGVMVSISHLWWAAQLIEGRTLAGESSLFAWFCAFIAPLTW